MIGLFDSGVGGLSVWKELVALMPYERYVYVSDSGYCPYGPQPREYIIDRAERISKFLIEKGADIIVVACNTATAASIDYLRSNFNIPFVGMEPAVKPAALQTESGVIGVLATQGTLRGELYLRTLHKFASNTKVIEQVGNGLVELVEQGKVDTPQAKSLLEKFIRPMLNETADHIVLGCTHYPFLIKPIREITGDSVNIVNPAPAIARQTMAVLGAKSSLGGIKPESNLFCTTGNNLELLERMVNEIISELKDSGVNENDCFPAENRFCSIDI